MVGFDLLPIQVFFFPCVVVLVVEVLLFRDNISLPIHVINVNSKRWGEKWILAVVEEVQVQISKNLPFASL